MFSKIFPNKYRSTVEPPESHIGIWPTLGTLWGFSLGVSFYFMDDLYLHALAWEDHPNPILQQSGKEMIQSIESTPQIRVLSQMKNQWSTPIERFYEREMRLGTRKLQPLYSTSLPPQFVTRNQNNETTPTISDTAISKSEVLPTEEATTPLPRKVLMLGGSSMKTAMGSLLQNQFRTVGVESIREAQIGTGLARADVVDWVAKATNILEVHSDIDLVLVQFIGNDCQTLVDADHQIIARYGTPEWTEAYLERWENLYKVSQKQQATMVILGLPIMESQRFDRKIQTVSESVFAWAEEHDIPIVTVRDLTTNEQGGYQQYIEQDGRPLKIRLKDGVHLSFQGSKIVSQHIFENLHGLLKWSLDAKPPIK